LLKKEPNPRAISMEYPLPADDIPVDEIFFVWKLPDGAILDVVATSKEPVSFFEDRSRFLYRSESRL